MMPDRLHALSGVPAGFPDIALTGKMGAGKSTAAEILTEFGYQTYGFATPLKEVAKKLWPENGTKREYLQKLGVAVREIEPDTWVNLLLDARRCYTPGDPCVVDDLRFPNEWWGLVGAGFVIVRVEAPRDQRISRLTASGRWTGEEALEHESETAVDDLTPTYTIVNDGSRSLLAAQILTIVEKESVK